MTPINKITRAYKKGLTSVLVFSIANNILLLALPIYSLQSFDRVVNSGSTDTLLMLTLIVFISFIGFGVINLSRSLVINSTNTWIEKRVAPELLKESIYSSCAQGRKIAIGRHLSDLNTIKSFVSGHAVNFFFDVPWSIVFIFVIFLIHPIIGIICTLGCIVIFSIALTYEIITRKIIESSEESQSKNISVADEAARNSEAIIAMGMLKQAITNWQREHRTFLLSQDILNLRSSSVLSFLKVIRYMLQIAVTGIGVYLVLQNKMTMGGVIACSILSSRAFSPFESSIMSWKSFVSARKSYNTLKEVFNTEPEKTSTVKLPLPKGELTLENVSYISSVTQKPIIKRVSLNLKAGETLGIVGRNAAGKSTLSKLMAGILKSSEGEVRLDGAEVHYAIRKGLGKFVGYLPQHVQLFDASVAENISRLSEVDTSDEKIVKAAELVGIHEMILRMPEGYETKIGADGSFLSAGQRQSLILARAFYGDPKLLILDEPNTNLDHYGEAGLAKALKHAKDNKTTTIIISHSNNSLLLCDRILVMDNGAMKMIGPAKEILSKISAGNQGG